MNVNILMKNQGARPGLQGMHAVSTKELIYYMLLVAHCTQYDCGGGQTFKYFRSIRSNTPNFVVHNYKQVINLNQANIRPKR